MIRGVLPRRGRIALGILLGAFVLSWFSPLFVGERALVVRHDGQWWVPVLQGRIAAEDLGQSAVGEARYRALKRQYADEGRGDWVWLPLVPFGPTESLLTDPSLDGPPPTGPTMSHWLGTDDRGRDVLARLVYGFRISLAFGVGVLLGSYAVGIAVGATLGWFGGAVDLVGQRLVEIWSGLPFLYTVLLLSQVLSPSLPMLIVLLSAFQWMGISAYVRAEVYRERGRAYVWAAYAQGEPTGSIVIRQVLPNALTSVLAFAPFVLIANITALVALDTLGFGLPPPTPSWGELIAQGLANRAWHLVVFPTGALFATLLLAAIGGDAVREALDPRHRQRWS